MTDIYTDKLSRKKKICTTIPINLWNLARKMNLKWTYALCIGIRTLAKDPELQENKLKEVDMKIGRMTSLIHHQARIINRLEEKVSRVKV